VAAARLKKSKHSLFLCELLRLCCHEALLVLLADQLDDVAAAGDGGWKPTAGGGPVADHVEVVESGQPISPIVYCASSAVLRKPFRYSIPGGRPSPFPSNMEREGRCEEAQLFGGVGGSRAGLLCWCFRLSAQHQVAAVSHALKRASAMV